MSSFEFFCQYCGQRLAAESKDAGRKVECPVCQSRFPIPSPPERQETQAALTLSADVDEEEEPAPDWSGSSSEPATREASPSPPITGFADGAQELSFAGGSEAPSLEARETQPGLLEFPCPFCTQALSATPADVGQEAVCPVCDTSIQVPAAGEVAQPVEAGGFAEPLDGESESSGSNMTTRSESSWETISHSDSSFEMAGEAAGDMFGEGFSETEEEDFAAAALPAMNGEEPVEVPAEQAEEIPVAPVAAEEDFGGIVDLPDPEPMEDVTASGGASVPVLKTFKPSEPNDPKTETSKEETLTDGAAGVIRVEAMKTVEAHLARSRATCGILAPEFDVKPRVAPQFYAFTRSRPTGTKSLWVFIFFRLHVIAFEPETRTEVICRSPDFSLDVLFRPGGQEPDGRTLFGLQLHLLNAAAKQARTPKDDDAAPASVEPGEKVPPYEVCKVRLSLRAAGGAAQAAQEVALKLKGWMREHPVLSKELEKRLKKRKSSPARPAPGPPKVPPKAAAPTPRRTGTANPRTKSSRPTRGKTPTPTTKRPETGGSERTKSKPPQRSLTRRFKKRK